MCWVIILGRRLSFSASIKDQHVQLTPTFGKIMCAVQRTPMIVRAIAFACTAELTNTKQVHLLYMPGVGGRSACIRCNFTTRPLFPMVSR